MYPFVNIHTHQQFFDNSISIYNNRFGFDETIVTETLFSIGIHPWDVNLKGDISEMESFIANKNCFAIGECGLDKLYNADLELQIKILENQLVLALKYHKPVIIHCVKAFDELLRVCEPYFGKVNLIIHGFNKSMQLAEQLLAKGFYLSVSDALLSKNDFDLKIIPANKLFFETDTVHSILINDIYKKASVNLNVNIDLLKEKIYGNFIQLKLPTH